MKNSTSANHDHWPGAFRLAVIAMATLVLCSCQSFSGQGPGDVSVDDTALVRTATESADVALPFPGPWHPPGLQRPWPHDEYLRDGGDSRLPASVRPDWTVDGLEQEDTIVHFDTVDGRTIVQPTNRLYIYGPRFGSVRRVDGLFAHEGHDIVYGMSNPHRLARHEERRTAISALQRIQSVGQRGVRGRSVYRGREQGGGLEREQSLSAYKGATLPYEDFQIIRSGRFDNREKVRLAAAIDSAKAWSHHQALQILIDHQQAIVDTTDQWTQTVFSIGDPTMPRLRVVKIASTDAAAPGETVEFTIRFDNVGDQPIGNVTLIDNLTTRLAFVPGSDKSTLEADFISKANEGGSLRLRWEIRDPIKPGEGGVVRFRCRVR